MSKGNITELSNEYTLKKKAENKQKKKNTFLRRRLLVISFFAMLLFTVSSITLYNSYIKLAENKTEQAKSLKIQAELKGEKAKLEKQVKLLQDDDYVAKLARSKYYYTKKGEKLYTVPDSQILDDSTKTADSEAEAGK